jgi:hypothetical protein
MSGDFNKPLRLQAVSDKEWEYSFLVIDRMQSAHTSTQIRPINAQSDEFGSVYTHKCWEKRLWVYINPYRPPSLLGGLPTRIHPI